MNVKHKLKLDWATFESAKYACENFHYSKCMPKGKTVKIGVWEDNIFKGVVIYSYGANNNAGKYFGLKQTSLCELTRVALRKHDNSVSRILKISLILLKEKCPGLRLVFSYSDKTNEDHHGGIYQANGWLYLGERTTSDKGAYYKIKGKKMHGRAARAKYGSERNFPGKWEHWPAQTKHLYVKILDKNYCLNYIVKQYPKRVASIDNDVPSDQLGEGGASPTATLHSPNDKSQNQILEKK